MISEHLQAHLRYLNTRDAPYPLSHSQANLAALRLRTLGLPYTAVATVMREYHGISIGDSGWRMRLREMGVGPKPRNGQPSIPPQLRDRL